MDGDELNMDSSLSQQEIISLQDILEAFSAPLNEEQAWALCYQVGKYLTEDFGTNLVNFEGASGVLLSKDGNVRLSGFASENTEKTQQTENVVINSLGRAVYLALDYGLAEEEERELSHPLEELIEFMTTDSSASEDENTNDNNNVAARSEAADRLNVDEGIEDEQEWEEEEGEEREGRKSRGRNNEVGAESANSSANNADEDCSSGKDSGSLQRIPQLLKLCSHHLPQPAQACNHYQAVCRAVYAEYQDLATFLRRISGSKEIIKDLSAHDDSDGSVDDLQPRQWAKIWLSVVRDLRNGVKLKKLSEHEKYRAPIEYALTPYEMLMDDIRSRRYTLNKVMIDGKIPARLKKEAHDIVLDFIRSRPPLKPVPKDKQNRKPLRRESMHEKLMREIQSQPELKQIPITEKTGSTGPGQQKKRLGSLLSDHSTDLSGDEELVLEGGDSPQLPRKVLKAEFTLDWSEEESEGETSLNEADSRSRPWSLRQVKTDPGIIHRSIDKGVDNYDAGGEDEEEEDGDGDDILERAIQKILDDDGSTTDHSNYLDVGLPPDTLASTPEKTLTMSRSSLSSFDEIHPDEIPPQETPRRHSVGPCRSFQPVTKSFKKEECLSLTVEEVIHIRSVLVKAEIENIRVNARLYKAVLQDKVCFSCKKKFSLFQKKFKCRLCKKLICNVCCVKMFIPKEEFLHIPVESLSPNSPQRSPTHGLSRQRSISDPPTPFLQSSPLNGPKPLGVHLWRKPTPVENVCCECCTFLKNTRTGPAPNPEGAKGFPTPFSLAPAPLQRLGSLSS